MGIRSLVRLANSPTILQNVKAWDELDYAGRSAAYKTAATEGGVRTVRVTKSGFLIPFALSASDKIAVPCRILESATGGASVGALVTDLKAITNNNVFDTLPTDFSVPTFNGFKRPARVTLTVRTKMEGDSRTSRITKRSYSKVQSDSVSQSFGQLVGGTLAGEGDYESIHKQAKLAIGTATNKVYKVTPEGSR